jgi:hypothetical protein
MNESTLLNIMFVCIILITAINIFVWYQSIDNMGIGQFNTEGYLPNDASGIYIPNSGFFVDTRGRNFEAINKTIIHEECHALIAQYYNRSHFCGVE